MQGPGGMGSGSQSLQTEEVDGGDADESTLPDVRFKNKKPSLVQRTEKLTRDTED